MHQYIRTHLADNGRNRWNLLIGCVALALFAISIPASAQNGRVNTNTAGAELHIRVNVVPVIMLPIQKRDPGGEAITFDFRNQQQPLLTTKEEIRPLPRAFGGRRSESRGNAVLKILTVVPE